MIQDEHERCSISALHYAEVSIGVPYIMFYNCFFYNFLWLL